MENHAGVLLLAAALIAPRPLPLLLGRAVRASGRAWRAGAVASRLLVGCLARRGRAAARSSAAAARGAGRAASRATRAAGPGLGGAAVAPGLLVRRLGVGRTAAG